VFDENTLELQPVIEEVVQDVIQDHHLSYNALKSSMDLGTMKFHGTINGLVIQIPLDIGSSDNFFQSRIANYLKLLLEDAPYMVISFNCLVLLNSINFEECIMLTP